MLVGHTLYLKQTVFPIDSFWEDVQPFLQVIARVLGEENTSTIDREVIGMFNLVMQPEVTLDIPNFWEDLVNSKFSNLNLSSCFIFLSLLVFLFLYVHVEIFMHLGLNIMDSIKRKQEW